GERSLLLRALLEHRDRRPNALINENHESFFLVAKKNGAAAARRRYAPNRGVAATGGGKEREMEFLTNNLQWSAGSVADLYRCRWQIEVFFKQIKQSLQLCDFLGNSANAVRWQVWMALLLYVLMRFLCVISSWNHSFTRLFTLLRAALWRKIDLWDLLRFCGTAGGHFRYLATPQNAY